MSMMGSSVPPLLGMFMAMACLLVLVRAAQPRGGGSVMNPTLAMPARWQA
jgi:hypothetical protein